MKTSIYIPDDLFFAAEKVAKECNITLNELYQDALIVYLKWRADNEITEQIDEICMKINTELDTSIKKRIYKKFAEAEW